MTYQKIKTEQLTQNGKDLLSGVRRARSVSTNIKCKDNDGRPCRVKGSVRHSYVSLFVEGGDEWAHMTTKQAIKLAQWIVQAVEEAEARSEN